MGWVTGIEPTTSRATIWRSNQLSYTHHKLLARQRGLEPLTYCLEGSCSIQLSYWRISWTIFCGKKIGASDGNRAHTTSWEGWDSTIELHSRTRERLLLYYIILKKSSVFFKKGKFFSFSKKQPSSTDNGC